VLLGALPAQGDDTFRVMSFNIWVGGEPGGQALEQTAKVIQAARADVVGMQESRAHDRETRTWTDNGVKIAEMLGWNYVYQKDGRAILSRFEIKGLTENREGAEIVLPSGKRFFLFNVHLPASPYQPYQLLKIPYNDAPFLETSEELVQAAREARGKEIGVVLAEMGPPVSEGRPAIMTGDFNEPSHLDWTERAAGAGTVPLAVPYPTTLSVTELGMRDCYRTLYPDETLRRGLTWTPTTTEDDPQDRHDRIDMIFVSDTFVVGSCEIVGEQERYADIVVTPYPSDHRAVVAEVTLTNEPEQEE